MSLKDKAIVFCKRFGRLSSLGAAKSGAKMALNALLPGGSVVVDLVEFVLDCVHETGKDQLTFEDRPLTASAEDLRRVEEMLGTLTDDLTPFMERVVRLEKRQEEVDRVFAEAMETLDERGRNALRQIDHLARRFDRLDEQNKILLQGQGYAAGLLAEMLPVMRRLAGVADYIDDLCTAGVSAADFRSCLHEFQDAARAFRAGRIAEAENRFQNAAQSQPRSAAAATALAGAKAAGQDFLAAEKSIARAARLRPGDPELVELHRRVTVASRGATPREQLAPGVASQQPPKVGDTLDGWRMDLLLGHGGWGRVFKASRGSEVRALKVMHPELSRDPLFVERFKKEILTLASLRGHKHLVAIDTFGYAAEAACWYFLMELIDGTSLERYLQRRGALTLQQARPVFLAVADGLATAHARGIIHRDIKPANIVLRRDGTPVLVDFGLAAVADDKGLTQTGHSAGYTAMFAAPEQLRGKPADARSDVYSLAASLYYALAYDQPVFREPHLFEPEQVPEEVRQVLIGALRQNPDRRTQTVGAFGDALQASVRRTQTVAAFGNELRASVVKPVNVDITFPAHWYARSADDPEVAWTEFADTPAKIQITPREVYRVSVSMFVTDAELAGLTHLRGLTGLQDLDLRDCKWFTDAGLAHLRGLTGLQKLYLSGCEQVTDEGVAYLRGMTGLQVLSLSGCEQVTDAGLAYLQGLTGLQILYLRGCDQITDAGLAYLRALTGLQKLDLEGCKQVTDAGLAYLRALTGLQKLDLTECKQFTDAGLAHLRGLTRLKILSLVLCEQVTDAGLAHLRGMTGLQELDLYGCEEITDEGVAGLRETLPKCKIT